MKLNELLSNEDYAGILENLLKKSISPKFGISPANKTIVWVDRVVTMEKDAGSVTYEKATLEFRIEVKRVGKLFDVDVVYGRWSKNYQLKTMQQVVELINTVDGDIRAWVLTTLPVALHK